MRYLVSIFILALVAIAPRINAQPTLNGESQKQLVMSNLSSMPLCFTENRGQWDEKAIFKAEAGGATFWYCRDEVVYQFTRDTDELIEDSMPHGRKMPEEISDNFNHPRYKKESMVLRAQFVGANPDVEIIGKDRLSHNNNYFYGNVSSKWATDVPNYSSITYKDIYPGIDLIYHGNGQAMKYDFIVNPGANISHIKIRYEGANNLEITSSGELQADTRFGLIYENIPLIYQESGSQKTEISGRYVVVEPGVFSFQVDNYNSNLSLVIDPELIYSTYLGGSAGENGHGIAVDGFCNAYVTGFTTSTDFPTQNQYEADQNETDTFVTKLSPSGDSIIYSTYLGGNGDDHGRGIAVDGSGYVYVMGYTWSIDFPTQAPYQTYQGSAGCNDAFVTKLSPTGNSLVYSTYLGGNDYDFGWGIEVDGSGSAYVMGYTWSTNFPTQNPYQADQFGSDAFVTKLSPSGDSIIYSTYLGGNGDDYGWWGIAIDGSHNAYVTGFTESTNFPTQNPFQVDQIGTDAFVTKISPLGNSLVYSTYLGGDDSDYGEDISVDSSGSAYVTGSTQSTNFPTQDPYQSDQPNRDAFVTKLSPSGNSLVYSTYLGGSDFDLSIGIAVDGSCNAYITGYTNSSNFPTQNPYQTDQAFGDAFVSKISASGNSLIYSTYLGGNGDDYGDCISVNGGNAYVTGYTGSGNFPTQNPYQTDQAGNDAFVTKIAQFELYEINASSGPNGIISPSGVVSIYQGSDTTFNITPNIGYHVLDVLVDGNSVGAVTSYTFSEVIANHTIEASFAIDTFIIEASTGLNGTISPLGAAIVNYGSDTTFTITPDIGYHVLDVLVDSISMGPLTSFHFSNVTTNHSISATFDINMYAISASSDPNGSISPSGDISVIYGQDTSFAMTPNIGYHIANVLVDGVSVGPVASYQFSAVDTNHTISVTFEINTFSIVAQAGENGSILPSETITVNFGSDTTFTISPNIGYHVANVVVDDSTVGPVLSYHFANVTANHTISASFAINTYAIAATAGPNGSITPAGEIPVDYGGNQTFSILADSGYHVIEVLVDGDSIGPVAEYTFSNITANHTISAIFAINVYTITANSGPNGTISPSGLIGINYGSDTTFTMIPNIGYHVLDVSVDGNLIGPFTSYTFSDISANHSISVSFTINTFMIIATAGQHGTISPSGVVIVDYGKDTTFTITPDLAYRIADVLVDGASVGPVLAFTFNDVINGHIIAANFTGECDYIIGDVNNNGAFNGIDVVYGVNYFKGGNEPPYTCECNSSTWFVAGDVNGSCSFNGIDISFMVAYYKGGTIPVPCPDCPPAIMITGDRSK
jgi:hypothetical protein